VRELNAIASVDGSFVYNPTFGATLPAGIHTLSVGFTPKDLLNQRVTSKTVTISVEPLPPLAQPIAKAPRRVLEPKPTPPKTQECQSGSICDQDSPVQSQTVNNYHQSAVELSGSGPYTNVQISDVRVAGLPTKSSSHPLVSMDSTTGPIEDGVIDGVHYCNLNYWDDLLDCVSIESPNSTQIPSYVADFRNRLQAQLAKRWKGKENIAHCISETTSASQKLIDNVGNETETLAYLRGHRPECLLARPQ
jgi:hypothetical protein